MSLNKSIESGKERRAPYRGAKAHCYSCRNHGTCEWCKQNRLHGSIREMARTKDEIDEYFFKEDNC